MKLHILEYFISIIFKLYINIYFKNYLKICFNWRQLQLIMLELILPY